MNPPAEAGPAPAGGPTSLSGMPQIPSLSSEILLTIFELVADSPRTLCQLERVCKEFQRLLRENTVWRAAFIAWNRGLAKDHLGRLPTVSDVPIPWRDLMRDQLRFHSLWPRSAKPSFPFANLSPTSPASVAARFAVQASAAPNISLRAQLAGLSATKPGLEEWDAAPTAFDTIALNFKLGPNDTLRAFKWVVQDFPSSTEPADADDPGVIAILTEWTRPLPQPETPEVPTPGRPFRRRHETFYAVFIVTSDVWMARVCHCLTASAPRATPDNPDPESIPYGQGRVVKLLAVDRKARKYWVCDWDHSNHTQLIVRSFDTPHEEELAEEAYSFDSQIHSQELFQTPDGNLRLLYIDPDTLEGKQTVLDQDLRPLASSTFPGRVTHFHYDAAFPDYLLTSTMDGYTQVWSLANADAPALLHSKEVMFDFPVELSVWRPWCRPALARKLLASASASSANGARAKPFWQDERWLQSLSVTMEHMPLDGISLQAAGSVVSLGGAPAAPGSSTDLELGATTGPGAAAGTGPADVRNVLRYLDFWACLLGYHAVLLLDSKGDVCVRDLATGESLGVLASLDATAWQQFTAAGEPELVAKSKAPLLHGPSVKQTNYRSKGKSCVTPRAPPLRRQPAPPPAAPLAPLADSGSDDDDDDEDGTDGSDADAPPPPPAAFANPAVPPALGALGHNIVQNAQQITAQVQVATAQMGSIMSGLLALHGTMDGVAAAATAALTQGTGLPGVHTSMAEALSTIEGVLAAYTQLQGAVGLAHAAGFAAPATLQLAGQGMTAIGSLTQALADLAGAALPPAQATVFTGLAEAAQAAVAAASAGAPADPAAAAAAVPAAAVPVAEAGGLVQNDAQAGPAPATPAPAAAVPPAVVAGDTDDEEGEGDVHHLGTHDDFDEDEDGHDDEDGDNLMHHFVDTQGTPFGDLVWLGDGWDRLLAYRGSRLCILVPSERESE
ncbi:hypothetical protein H9P43_004692 [Blastocladiella emersonii ATCC 22665]|nr:hypothetical protein H9P43_004692 [Blastocladiella emersonii ATCC 22665]